MELTFARVRNMSKDSLAETHQTYVIKNCGTAIGELAYDFIGLNSTKKPCWVASVFFGVNVVTCYYGRTKELALKSLKTDFARLVEQHSYMGFKPGEQVLYRDDAMYIVLGSDAAREVLYLGYDMGGKPELECHPADLN